MKQTVNVANKNTGSTVYAIPELQVRRVFAPNELKKDIPLIELEKLVQMPGGKELFYNYLYVEDEEVVSYLINGRAEQEYWMKASEIPSWINSCSLDAFKDALDFAPNGTKELIKKYAVENELNDFSKRQAIKDQLGFDVTKAIELNHAYDNDKDKEEKTTTQRRVAPTETTVSSQRRVVTPSK